ncbi:MAG: 16S rRNA (guanine(966)-N(2))-methyltransferase RsmD [Nitrospirae bacterium]|nr:16S rRNA (guanine(966)-N(2))-methyltransferase RsmD [Nitrospirota bacterium]
MYIILMKITGGIFKGRKLPQKIKKGVRPTASKVREALFNIIGADINESSFLDLYAGTGVVGFEALARGASHVVFVDRDIDAIDKVIQSHKYSNCRAIKGEVHKVVNNFQGREQKFDFIYVDPPYESGEVDQVMPLLGQILSIDGFVIVEHFHKKEILNNSQLEFVKTYRYGDTVLSLFKGFKGASPFAGFLRAEPLKGTFE